MTEKELEQKHINAIYDSIIAMQGTDEKDLAIEATKVTIAYTEEKTRGIMEQFDILREENLALQSQLSQLKQVNEIAEKALIQVKGVMPFHDGDFTHAESLAMIKIDEALQQINSNK